MKKVILLALLFPYTVSGQINENFESASVSGWVQGTEGRWKADTSGAISGLYSLHHVFDNPSSGSDCIGLAENDLHPEEGTARWSFSIRHGCDPSSSNNWCIYLMSDVSPALFGTGSAVSGFAIGVNLTGYDDTLRLWKIKNGSATAVVTLPVNWQNDIGTFSFARLVVDRLSTGNWNISVYNKQSALLAEKSGFSADLFYPGWFIVNYKYTSSRDRLLWLDDLTIEGIFRADNQPPVVTSCIATGINSIELSLSETPAADFSLLTNFIIEDGAVRPSSVVSIGPAKFRLTFPVPFTNKKQCKLIISKLCDLAGNCRANLKADFLPVWADPGDVVITEIMADPLPVVSLPPKEYIEIFNRSEFPIRTKKWTLNVTGQSAQFTDMAINAGEYIIICQASDTSSYSVYGKTMGLKSFPSLTDEGREIWLSDSLGGLIHGVGYSSGWYGNKLKSAGGWSLEMIDTDYPFFESGNWEASSSSTGGTPGKVNSASRSNRDAEFFGIENVFPVDEGSIKISLSETVFGLGENGKKVFIDNTPATSVVPADALMRIFIVSSPVSFLNGRIYSLSIDPSATDFAGNFIRQFSARFGMTEEASPGNVCFNELLFDPFPDEPEYIELFNMSDKVIDASGLFLASINSESGDTSDVVLVSPVDRCILPQSFFTITTDRDMVVSGYPQSGPENIFNTSNLPSMPDDKGHLLLLSRSLEKIDEAIYTSRMHSPLLSGTKGISLEKIRPDMISAESTSWHSASESSGWGTPGQENSVFEASGTDKDRIKFSSSSISPDNDGNDDVLVIDINGEGLGNVISVTIFDESGMLIRRLRENFYAGNRASVAWDATASDGSLVPAGIYIILIELYNDKGKTRSWKKVCSVIR
jgi:hypothetical protein